MFVKCFSRLNSFSQFKDKLQGQFPGYGFNVYNGGGEKARGNMLMGNLRRTYNKLVGG